MNGLHLIGLILIIVTTVQDQVRESEREGREREGREITELC